MNWGQLGGAIIGNIASIVKLVEGIRGKREGVQKQNLAVDLFFALVSSQEENDVVDRIEHAEDEVRGVIDAVVALENKLRGFNGNP